MSGLDEASDVSTEEVEKNSTTLEGLMTVKDFTHYVRDNLPNFFKYNLESGQNFFETLVMLHDVSNASFPFFENRLVEDRESMEFLHSMYLTIVNNRERIEKIFAPR